jgi:starch phosphorylase
VPQLSVLDGWWLEGYNGLNGWAFEGSEGEGKDDRDAAHIYGMLEKEIIPAFYSGTNGDGVPHGWIKVMKEAIKSTAPAFCTRRMIKEYSAKFYQKALLAAAENDKESMANGPQTEEPPEDEAAKMLYKG